LNTLDVTGQSPLPDYLLSVICYLLLSQITSGDTDRHRLQLAPRRAKLIGLTLG
jgi:hypothetical protein